MREGAFCAFNMADIMGKIRVLSLLLFMLVVGIYSLVRIHHRVQTILLGYEIGKLKEHESQLLKKQSLLTMDLAKLTNKQNLAKRINIAGKE